MDSHSPWPWMIFMAFLLGLRHGLDLDHLATIDAITRTVRDTPWLSKLVGFLFSLGHGIIVTTVSLLIGSGLMESHTPGWLEGFGSWISITCLILFGLLNLWTVIQPSSSESFPLGIKSLLAKKLMRKNFNPFMVVLIGALFALSFDTFSQITLFSLSASLMEGWVFSGVLGLFFTIGMMVTDGCNGLFVSEIVLRADGASLLLSRSLGILIALFSLVTGAIGILNLM